MRPLDPVALAFFSGLFTAGFSVASLFFVRFWYRTRDDLFLSFALAFVLLALGEALVPVIAPRGEDHPGTYLFRLAAFLAISVAILRKNLKP